jgi:hypothetical protein
MTETLNDRQAELLRRLEARSGPVPSAGLDGRVLRALRGRGCIEERDGSVEITAAGREALSRAPAPRRRASRAAAPDPAAARQLAILRALEGLEEALPAGAEVAVGPIFAYADDVVKALRRYARTLPAA